MHQRLVPGERIQRLREVPGIGVIGAYTILTETDDMSRFPTAGQYLSYGRLVPGASNSGGKSRRRNSKQGNRYLKTIYTEAAVRAVQWYPWFVSFTTRKPVAPARAWLGRSWRRNWQKLSGICYIMTGATKVLRGGPPGPKPLSGPGRQARSLTGT